MITLGASGKATETRAGFWKIQAGVFMILAAALYPLLKLCVLPPRIDISHMARAYFLGNGPESLAPLLLFYLIQKPGLFRPLYKNRGLIPLLAVLAGYLWWLNGGSLKPFTAEISLAVLALLGYSALGRNRLSFSLLTPALYLFGGLVVVFSYAGVESAMLDFAKFDRVFLAADRALLFGHSIGEISRWMLAFPHMGQTLELIYYGLFGVIGATLLWLTCEGGSSAALNFACDILTCYLITLATYWMIPSVGPFLFTPSSAAIQTAQLQNLTVPYLNAVRANHSLFLGAESGFFVAFPSMHIVQSILIAWHMRRWPRLFWPLAAFNGFLIVAILGLQQHYAVDLLGGLAVVFLGVGLREGLGAKRLRRSAANDLPQTIELAG